MPVVGSVGAKEVAQSEYMGLRPFEYHGVELVLQNGQGVGECPFCEKEKKFYVNPISGLWNCFVCGQSGNPIEFLRNLWETCKLDKIGDVKLEELAKDRRISVSTLIEWGVAWNSLRQEYVLPGFTVNKVLHTLYRRCHVKDGDVWKWLVLPTPGIHKDGNSHGLFGGHLFNPKRITVYIAEGPWDGMALYEGLRSSKVGLDGTGLMLTGTTAASLLAQANVIAVPGANVFQEGWTKLLDGKDVRLMFDNDHPRTNGKAGSMLEPVGHAGMRRVSGIVAQRVVTKSLSYLKWGKDGLPHDPDKPDGYDVRDAVTAGKSADRPNRVGELLAMMEAVPEAWVTGGGSIIGSGGGGNGQGGSKLQPTPCHSWEGLLTSWRLAMQWTEGLEKGLSCMLAAAVTTKAVGSSQLWMKMMSPPSTGKSTLAEALNVAGEDYVLCKSVIKGLHSGFKSDMKGKVNHSLFMKLKDKTFIIKDGDTLMASAELPRVLSDLRDAYDKATRSDFRNGMGMDYEGWNMTCIVCGTSSLHRLDDTELGDRFLVCRMMEGIDDELEDTVLMHVAERQERCMALESNGDAESWHDPNMIDAMQKTGGYLVYLRQNAQRLFATAAMDRASLRRCADMGKFIAYMRARPSMRQDEDTEREFGSRLTEQLVRLAKGLTVVRGRPNVDGDVMGLVESVAMDSAAGRTLRMAKEMHKCGETGIRSRGLGILMAESEKKVLEMLRFLRKIEAVELFNEETMAGFEGQVRWRLSAKLQGLFDKVIK